MSETAKRPDGASAQETDCPGAATKLTVSSGAYDIQNTACKYAEPTQVRAESELYRVFGENRMATFLRACNGDRQSALELYTWNIAISAAFWGSFNVLEVVLRNAIHAALSAEAGREDWWHSSVPIHPFERHRVSEALLAAERTKGGSVTAGHVVAELSLGFWTGLLSNRYHQRLWVPTLSLAFPHLTGTRRELHRKQESLRKLRNRIAHHEPIFARNLTVDHAQLLSVVGAISQEATSWVQEKSRVWETIARRGNSVAGAGESKF